VAYKIDTDAIALKVKQEFAAKEKAKKEVKTVSSGGVRVAKQLEAYWGSRKAPPNSLFYRKARRDRFSGASRSRSYWARNSTSPLDLASEIFGTEIAEAIRHHCKRVNSARVPPTHGNFSRKLTWIVFLFCRLLNT
jgi:hypothetical protein